jgi:hypothetical protein
MFGCALLAVSCVQKVDDSADKGSALPFGSSLPDPDGGGPPIKIGVAIELADGSSTSDPCVLTTAQSLVIRQNHCAFCHAGGSAPASMGSLGTIMVDQSMINQKSVNYAGEIYLIPGDPDNSFIYKRAVVTRDMPKRIGDAPVNTLTPSEASVFREWIKSCLGPSPADSGNDGSASDRGPG